MADLALSKALLETTEALFEYMEFLYHESPQSREGLRFTSRIVANNIAMMTDEEGQPLYKERTDVIQIGLLKYV